MVVTSFSGLFNGFKKKRMATIGKLPKKKNDERTEEKNISGKTGFSIVVIKNKDKTFSFGVNLLNCSEQIYFMYEIQ